MSNTLVSLNANEVMGADTKRCAIVPVKVKLERGTKIVQTYAFLDEGSSAMFCTEALMHQLNADFFFMFPLVARWGHYNRPTRAQNSGPYPWGGVIPKLCFIHLAESC